MNIYVLALWSFAAVLLRNCRSADLEEPLYNDYELPSRIIISLATMLPKRSALITLFDEKNENHTSAVFDITNVNRRVVKFSLDNTRSFLYQHLEHLLSTATSVDDYRDNLVFIVICSDCFSRVIKVAGDVDRVVGQHTLRHFSKWLFMTEYVAVQPATAFDNIAWIIVGDTGIPSFEEKCSIKDGGISTLLWMPDGRTWSEVYISHLQEKNPLHQVFPNTQRGLNGRHLKIVTLQWFPQTIRKVANGTVTYVGASVDYIHFLSRVYNFTYTVEDPNDGTWGSRMENGSWTGVTGMVQRGEADMSGCPYAIGASRTEFLDFTPPVYTSEFVVIYASTRSPLYFWRFLTSGLSWEVYPSCAALLLCTVTIYICISCLTGSGSEIQSTQYKLDIILTFIGVSVRQGIPSDLKGSCSITSGRVLVFSWAFFCLLMTAIYSGSLVANTTVDKYEIPFTTVQELADQNEYTISSYQGLLPLEIMEKSKYAVYQKLYNKAKRNIVAGSSTYLEDGLQHILKDRYALIVNGRSYSAMRANSCEIRRMKERLFSTSASFVFPRRSPLVKLFHDGWITDTGVAQKMQSHWLPAPLPCERTPGVTTNQFTLEHLKSLLVVCLTGIGLGGVTLLFENRRYLPLCRNV